MRVVWGLTRRPGQVKAVSRRPRGSLHAELGGGGRVGVSQVGVRAYWNDLDTDSPLFDRIKCAAMCGGVGAALSARADEGDLDSP